MGPSKIQSQNSKRSGIWLGLKPWKSKYARKSSPSCGRFSTCGWRISSHTCLALLHISPFFPQLGELFLAYFDFHGFNPSHIPKRFDFCDCFFEGRIPGLCFLSRMENKFQHLPDGWKFCPSYRRRRVSDQIILGGWPGLFSLETAFAIFDSQKRK